VVGATHWNGNEKSFGMRVEGAVVTGMKRVKKGLGLGYI